MRVDLEKLLGDRVPLGALPTPVHACDRFTDVALSLKRDDLIGDLVTGTKVRALAYILRQGQRDGVTDLITLGEPTSNQCRLVAMLGARYGMATHILLRGSACDDERDENLAIMRMHGAQLHILSESEWRLHGMAAKRLMNRVRKAGGRARFLPFGCGGLPGALGVVDLVHELLAQHDGDLPYSHIVIPSGSGATIFAFDIALQLLAREAPTPALIGVSVAQDEPTLLARIDALYRRTSAALGLELRRSDALSIDARWRELTAAERIAEFARVSRRYAVTPDPHYVLPAFLSVERLGEQRVSQRPAARALLLVSGACRTLAALQRRTS